MEILYRGKSVETETLGKWIYGFYREYKYSETQTNYFIDAKGQNESFFVDPETVGQWTGRTDNNKYKLFGGDKFWDGDFEQYFTAEWDEEKLSWMAVDNNCSSEFLSDIWNEVCTIVGNIHDKPKGDAE